MAEREFIKIYNVDPKSINSKGELDPDAGLYPAFAEQYGYGNVKEKDLPERFGRPITYDNATNRGWDMPVHMRNKTTYGQKKVAHGPEMNRGFSTLAYEGPDKRPSGSRADTFDSWKSTGDVFTARAADPRKLHYKRVLSDAAENAIESITDSDRQKLSRLEDIIDKSTGLHEDGSVIEDPNTGVLLYGKCSEARRKGSGRVYEKYYPGDVNEDEWLADSSKDFVRKYGGLFDAYERTMLDAVKRGRQEYVDKAFNDPDYNKRMYVRRLKNELKRRFPIEDDGLLRIPVIVTADDEDVVNISDVINNNYDPLRDSGREIQLKRILARRLPEGLFQPTGDKFEINESIYNDLDKWFPYSSSKTYSDERLKDISKALSRDGCCDIKLHDNHIKAITDDFRKWLSDSDDKSAILSGIKELGQ